MTVLDYFGNASGPVILVWLLAAYLAGVGTKDYVVWAWSAIRVLYARTHGRNSE